MRRSLLNENADSTILGVPFQNTPTSNDQIIIYQLDSSGNGYFIFGNISSAGGINVVNSSGIGASLINSLVGGTLTLKSILSTNPNIGINNLSNQIELTMGPFLTNIFSITNSIPLEIFPGTKAYQYELTQGAGYPDAATYDFMIYEAADPLTTQQGYFISINDKGTNTNRELIFECIKNGVGVSPLRIMNNGNMYVNLPTITPINFVGVDNTGKLGTFTSSTILLTALANVGIGTGQIYKNTVAGTANLRTILGDANLIVTTTTDEVQLNLNSMLNGIASINLLTQATPLDIASDLVQFEGSTIKFPNIPSNAAYSYLYAETTTGEIERINPPTPGITTINTSGVGASIVKSVVGTTATLKSINGTNSIGLTDDTNTLTLALDPILNNITEIHSTAGNLLIDAVETTLSNIPAAGTTVNAITMDFSNRLRYAPFFNNFSSVGGGIPLIENTTANTVNFRTLNASTNITINSTGGLMTIATPPTLIDVRTINSATSGNTIFGNDVIMNAGQRFVGVSTNATPTYYMTFDASNNVTKTLPASASTNIYNSDGTMTALNRVVSPFTPGNVDNKITFSNVAHSFVNSIRYNTNYLGTTVPGTELNFMRFYDSLGDSWGKYEATNCETRITSIPALGAPGNYNIFYTSLANGVGQLSSWNLRVYIYENNPAQIAPWSAIYEINLTANNNTVGFQSIYPTTAQTNDPYILEVAQAIGGNQFTMLLRLRNIGTLATTDSLTAKIESYTKGDKSINTPNVTGNVSRLTIGPSLQTSMKVLNLVTVGQNITNSPPSLLWNYFYYPRMLKVTYFLSCNSTVGNGSVTLSFILNGISTFSQVMRHASNNGTLSTINGFFYVEGYAGFSSGRLVGGLNTLNITASNNTQQNFTNCSYTLNLEFI